MLHGSSSGRGVITREWVRNVVVHGLMGETSSPGSSTTEQDEEQAEKDDDPHCTTDNSSYRYPIASVLAAVVVAIDNVVTSCSNSNAVVATAAVWVVRIEGTRVRIGTVCICSSSSAIGPSSGFSD